MIPTDTALRDRHATELAVPDNQRRIEQSTSLEVGEESRDRGIRLGCVLSMIRPDVAVRVPGIDVLVAHAALEQLHVAHAVFHKTPRQQALPAEWFTHRVVHAVQLLGRLRLGLDVDRLRRASLHSVRELI